MNGTPSSPTKAESAHVRASASYDITSNQVIEAAVERVIIEWSDGDQRHQSAYVFARGASVSIASGSYRMIPISILTQVDLTDPPS